MRNWGSRLASTLVFLALARILQPAELGLFATAAAVVAFVEIFAESGLGDAIVQRQHLSEAEISAALLLNFTLALACAAVTSVAAPVIAAWLNMPAIADVLPIASLAIVLNALGVVQQAILRRELNFRRLALRSLIATSIGGGAGLAAAFAGLGVWSMIIQMLVTATINLILVWIPPAWTPRRFPAASDFGPITRFGANVFAARLVNFLGMRFIELAIALLLGPVAVALFVMGARVGSVLMQLFSAVSIDISLAYFSRIAANREAVIANLGAGLEFLVCIAAPIFVFSAAAASEIIALCFGENGRGSEPIMLSYSLMSATLVIQYHNSAVLNAVGKPGAALLMETARSVITLSTLWATRDHSLATIASVYALGQAFCLLISFVLVKIHLDASISALARRLAPLTIVNAGMFAAVLATRDAAVSAGWTLAQVLGAEIGAGAFAYMVLVGLFARKHFAAVLAAVLRKRGMT